MLDTGSADNTLAAAVRFGARVVSFEWQEDFSIARNALLKQLSGDWVLWLDAGETTTMCKLCCPGRAITVGDLDDPDSEVSKILAGHATTRLLEEEGTEPNVYYWNSLE